MNLIDFLSVILLKQQGLIPEKSKSTLNYFLKTSILPSDVSQDPFLFIKMLANFMIHNAMLVDIQGMPTMFNKYNSVEILSTVFQSAILILNFATDQSDMSLKAVCKGQIEDSTYSFKSCEDGYPLFCKQIVS